MSIGRTLVITVGLLAAGVWVGSLVCLALVARVASEVLDGPSRVSFFRKLGRLYTWVGTGSLLVAIAAGLAVGGRPSQWSAAGTAALVLSVFLVVLTLVAMNQAREMTKARGRSLAAPADQGAAAAVRRGAGVAGALRGSMAVTTLAIVILGARSLAR